MMTRRNSLDRTPPPPVHGVGGQSSATHDSDLNSDSNSSSLECHQENVSDLGVGSSASAADGDGVANITSLLPPSDSDSNNKGPKLRSDSDPTTIECHQESVSPFRVGSSASAAHGVYHEVADKTNLLLPSDSDSNNEGPKLRSDSSPTTMECHREVGSSTSPANGDGGQNGTSDSDSNSNSEAPIDRNGITRELDVGLVLPDDILHKLLSYLDLADFCRASTVCKQWRSVSSREDYKKSLYFHSQEPSLGIFAGICARHPNCTTVNLYGAHSLCLLAITALTSLRNLETLVVGGGQLTKHFFHALKDAPSLKSLSIRDVLIIPNHQSVHIGHAKLLNLEITNCQVGRISFGCPQLEILSMKCVISTHRARMPNLGLQLNCPQLRELAIDSCDLVSNEFVSSAACSCPLLITLDVSNSCLTNWSISRIAQTCVQLRKLNVSGCPNITFDSIRLPLLTVLKLDNCFSINSASMVHVSPSYMLQVLELGKCDQLTSILLNLDHLRSIRVSHCYTLTKLKLETPMLSSITVSDCYSLCCIDLVSNSLQKLVLPQQQNLTTLALNCPALEEVDLTDCRSLVDFGCDEFSDWVNSPTLRSVVLNSCVSLNTVRLHNTSLISLSLVGCYSLIALELTCPSLEQIYLNECGDLETALFCPVDLRSLNLGMCPKLSLLQIEAPQMVALELKGCGALSKASVRCPLLMSLDASFCSEFTDDCVYETTTSCPLTRSLILASCTSIGPYGLTSLRCLEHLTLLDLSYTYLVNLQPVFEYCLKLQVLKLQACKYLTDSSLKPLYSEDALPDLCELDLSHVRLCHSTIEEILARRTRLTYLSLNGCANMRDLNLGVTGFRHSESSSRELILEDTLELNEQSKHLLQNFNCIGCPNVRKVVIPAMARFVELLSMNLSLSENLKEVDIACSNLSILNLSNCCFLETIKLNCPRLTRLSLQFCSIGKEALEAAISRCTKLETLDVRDCPMIDHVSIARMRAVCPSLKCVFSSLV